MVNIRSELSLQLMTHECKCLGHKITQAKWDAKAPEIVDKVIRATVDQNPKIRKFLKGISRGLNG